MTGIYHSITTTCLIVMLIFMTGCNKGGGTTPPEPDPGPIVPGTEAKFSGTILPASSGVFRKDDAIGIYMITTDKPLTPENISENTINRKYLMTGEAARFTPATEIQKVKFPAVDRQVDFIAYYPYSEKVSEKYTLPIDVSQQSPQSDIDLLYSTNAKKQSAATPDVALSFEHQLAKLKFAITAESPEIVLRGIIVKINNISPTAIFSLPDGNFSGFGEKTAVTALTNTEGDFAEAIVLPVSENSGVTFSFAVSDTTLVYTPGTALIAGKEHLFNINIDKRTSLKVITTIRPWTNGNSFPGNAEQDN